MNPSVIWIHCLSTLSLPPPLSQHTNTFFSFTMDNKQPLPPKVAMSSSLPVLSSGAANPDTSLQNYAKCFSLGFTDQNRRNYLAWEEWFSLSEVVTGRGESPVCRLLKSSSSNWWAAGIQQAPWSHSFCLLKNRKDFQNDGWIYFVYFHWPQSQARQDTGMGILHWQANRLNMELDRDEAYTLSTKTLSRLEMNQLLTALWCWRFWWPCKINQNPITCKDHFLNLHSR